MSGTTSVPAPTFGSTGFAPPTEQAILTGVQADWNAAFGGNLNPGLSTPQGQLEQSQTAIIGDCNNQFLALANGVDPAYASGRLQDAIARIYFLTRNPAQSTVVTATCSGLFGTVIPVGAQAQDVNGNRYTSTASATIPIGGSVSLSFACVNTGPIACPIGALSTIYQAIPGWDSITNASAGVEGTNVESRADFEFRRQNSVAVNSQGSLPAVLGAVFGVSGVLDAYATENNTSISTEIGGVTLLPHSLYVAAYGGLASDIAEAIWTKKSPGCNYNGNTTVTVYDTSNGYYYPYPAYNVTFEIPTPTAIKILVTMINNNQVPSNVVTLVQNAVLAAFTGADGGIRATIGGTLYASRYYAGISALGAWAQASNILIGVSSPTYTYVIMDIDQIPTLTTSDITVNLS